MRITLISFCITLSLFAGCATKSPTKTPSDMQKLADQWSNHHASLQQINNWSIKGRFGAKSEEESWNGHIAWQQNDQTFRINLSGPLSSGSIELTGDQFSSTLKLSDEETFTASDPEHLLESHTGLRLPMSNLRYWMLGIPSPLFEEKTIALDEHGRLSKLNQTNWEVSYRRYKTINNLILPDKIFLENHEFDVRLVISRWQISS